MAKSPLPLCAVPPTRAKPRCARRASRASCRLEQRGVRRHDHDNRSCLHPTWLRGREQASDRHPADLQVLADAGVRRDERAHHVRGSVQLDAARRCPDSSLELKTDKPGPRPNRSFGHRTAGGVGPSGSGLRLSHRPANEVTQIGVGALGHERMNKPPSPADLRMASGGFGDHGIGDTRHVKPTVSMIGASSRPISSTNSRPKSSPLPFSTSIAAGTRMR